MNQNNELAELSLLKMDQSDMDELIQLRRAVVGLQVDLTRSVSENNHLKKEVEGKRKMHETERALYVTINTLQTQLEKRHDCAVKLSEQELKSSKLAEELACLQRKYTNLCRCYKTQKTNCAKLRAEKKLIQDSCAADLRKQTEKISYLELEILKLQKENERLPKHILEISKLRQKLFEKDKIVKEERHNFTNLENKLQEAMKIILDQAQKKLFVEIIVPKNSPDKELLTALDNKQTNKHLTKNKKKVGEKAIIQKNKEVDQKLAEKESECVVLKNKLDTISAQEKTIPELHWVIRKKEEKIKVLTADRTMYKTQMEKYQTYNDQLLGQLEKLKKAYFNERLSNMKMQECFRLEQKLDEDQENQGMFINDQPSGNVPSTFLPPVTTQLHSARMAALGKIVNRQMLLPPILSKQKNTFITQSNLGGQ